MSTKTPPTRLYFHHGDDTYSPIMWFHEYAPLEMIFGFYGVSSKAARLSFEYPQRNVSVQEARSVKFRYEERDAVDRPLQHITVHVSGEFHIKLKDAAEPYVHRLYGVRPLHPSTGQFLDFRVITDLPSSYQRAVEQPRRPYVVIRPPPNSVAFIDGRFSGAKYQLERELLAEVQRTTGRSEYGAIRLNGAYLKGMLRPTVMPADTAVPADRPPGTILAFFFPTVEQRYLVKAFHFC